MPLKKFVVAFAGLALFSVVAVAVAQDVVVDPAIATMTIDQKVSARQAAMKEDGGVLKGAGKLTGPDAVAAAEILIKNFTNFSALFSADTKDAIGSEAAPAIWDNWDAFNAIFTKALDGAKAMKVAAMAEDAAGYGAAMKTIGGACGECHQQFRSK